MELYLKLVGAVPEVGGAVPEAGGSCTLCRGAHRKHMYSMYSKVLVGEVRIYIYVRICTRISI